MKAKAVLLYRNYSKMFCLTEDNKIISGKENAITELK
jgi:hypothetical protein